MTTPAEGPLRWVRSAALTFAIVGLSTTAHVAAGGQAPSLAAVLVLTLACVLVSVLLTGRRLRARTLTAALGVMQVGMHHGLTLIGNSSCHSPLQWSHAAAHADGALTASALCTTHAHSFSAVGASLPPSLAGPVMILGHALATAVLVAWLCVGERALWMLATRLTRPVATPVSITLRRRVRAFVDRPAVSLAGRALTSGTGRRGPPAPARTLALA